MTLVVADRVDEWPLDLRGVEIVSARAYLTDPRFSGTRGRRVVNLCRSYGYQTTGYYVSLLAAARGHRPFPGLATVLDMQNRTLIRSHDDTLEPIVQRSLKSLKADEFTLSIYFGRNLARQHDRLAQTLFNLFPAPFLRARFSRTECWRLVRVGPIPSREIPEEHRPFVLEAAQAYLAEPPSRVRRRKRPRYHMAILHDPNEPLAPSGAPTLARYRRVAARFGFATEMIERRDYGRIPEFDALFIRETTRVDHHTFRFAQRAEAEGLAVMDDPQSILRCGNKVFMAELFERNGVATPKTVIVHAGNVDEVIATTGLPVVLKYPDGAFSQGVFKCSTEAELRERAAKLLEESDLVVAQEFLPTDFDWRIGVLDGRLLFACRYFMASKHWQIMRPTKSGSYRYGKSETVSFDKVPRRVLTTAVRAANLVGDGLYGVDMKEAGRRVVVIEVNDNPNIDVGCEDRVERGKLFDAIMQSFLTRVEKLKE